jgi:hypothetical protein
MLSNSIARMQRYYRASTGVATIMLANHKKNDGYKEAALFEGMEGGNQED